MTSRQRDNETLLGIRAISTRLNLSNSEVETALESGLLPDMGNNRTRESAVTAAEANMDAFLHQLDELTPLNITEAAKRIKSTPDLIKKAVAATGIPIIKTTTWKHGEVRYYLTRDITGPVHQWILRTEKTSTLQGKKKDRDTGVPSSRKQMENASQGQTLRIRVLTDTPGPDTFTIHAGPTNSGKTYMALAALAEAGQGVYAGPLRMLAREAYTKLCAMLGPENVGLITGEEQENPDAPVICATAEAAPLHTGGVLVVDECHWISDPQRGWAWTRLLVSGQFQHIHAITDPAAADLVASLVPDAKTTTRIYHPRLSTLSYQGTVPITDLPKGSAVVAFSRVSVLALAELLQAAGRRPAVLYGALPPIARLSQIQRLIDGDADIIVTTDVIGHGINLPLTAVALAETEKFDGESRRTLYKWEAAQILGRAGRYGHGTEIGETYSVTGPAWLTSPPWFIEAATSAAAGLTPTEWVIPSNAPIRPTLGELNVSNPHDLPTAVRAFAITTRKAAERIPIAPFNADPVLTRLNLVLPLLPPDDPMRVPVHTIWNLIMCPIDDDELITVVVGVLTGSKTARIHLEDIIKRAQTRYGDPLTRAETAAAYARNLRAVLVAVGDLPNLTMRDAMEWEETAGNVIVKTLMKTSTNQKYGKCASCGKECPPWFPTCHDCHLKNQWGYEPDKSPQNVLPHKRRGNTYRNPRKPARRR